MTWSLLLDEWAAIENDFQDRGIDVNSGILARRSARWLKTRILGLLTADTRLRRALQTEKG